jgi:hypothetical protein
MVRWSITIELVNGILSKFLASVKKQVVLIKYFFWVLAGGQPTFFGTVPSDDVVVPVFMFLHRRM